MIGTMLGLVSEVLKTKLRLSTFIETLQIHKGYTFVCTTHDITAEGHAFQAVSLLGLLVQTCKRPYLGK